MLNLYEEYASQEEREGAVMLEQAEIQMDRAILALETCDAMEALAMREAECRLVMESGDVCDLAEYYGEAAEDTAEKKEGLLTKLWNGILNFLKNIKETLFGKSQKADENKEYEVEKGWLDKHEKIKKAVEAVGRFFQNPAIKAASIAIAAIVAAIGIKAVGKKVKVKGGIINKVVAEENQATDKVESGIKSFLTKKVGLAEDLVKGLATKVSELTKHMRTSAANFIGLYTKEQMSIAEDRGALDGYMQGEQAGMLKGFKKGKNVALKEESAEDDDLSGDMYSEDAGDLSDIAELLATL